MESTSSQPTEKNLGRTTRMNSGLRIEMSEIKMIFDDFNICTSRSSDKKVGVECRMIKGAGHLFIFQIF